IVAEIGKETLTVPEVQNQIQNLMRGRQIPPALLPTYVPMLINDMVMERTLAYEAQRLGLRVTDKDLAEAIKQIAPNLFPDGKFVGKEAYGALLAQQNITIERFESDLRRQILASRLRDVAIEGTVVSPFEIEQTYRKNNEKIKAEYVKLTQDKYRNEVQPSLEDMQTYYKTNATSYTIPEKRDLAILIADQAKIAQTVTPSDADLQRAYSQNVNQFRTPERVKVRHILLKTTDKPAAEEPKIKAQAESLLKQIRSGGNFADLAKKYSEDPVSAAKGGELDWVARGQTVPEFEKAAFTLKPGQTGDLVKTQYGYHILQVEAHEEGRLRPFNEVKDELAAQWKKQRVGQLMEAISDKAQTELQKNPDNPEKVAADFNVQLVRATGLEPGKPAPEVGMNADFEQSISGLKKGEVSQPVALPGDKIALALVTNVIPSRPATFDEVKDQVRDRLVQNRLPMALQQHARELADKAKSMGSLAKAAKALGLEVKNTGDVTRASNVEGLGPAMYIQEAFPKPDGSIVGPISLQDGSTVVQVLGHIAPDMSQLEAQRAGIRDQIKGQKARDRNSLFEAGLKEQLVKEGKVKIHQDVINRLVGNYRG
ncbi:MAG TPA: peptidylprolyl isomerase, partial [Bryobacteraceae bacterium]